MTNKIIENSLFGALLLFFLSLTLVSCSTEELNGPSPGENSIFISAVDLSSYPEIFNSNPHDEASMPYRVRLLFY